MKAFFKTFFASFFAVTIFFLLLVLVVAGIIKMALDSDVPEVKAKTVLVIDISKPLMEQRSEGGFNLPGGSIPEITGLFDLVNAIETAATDTSVKGIFLVGSENGNGFATTEALNKAIAHFQQSKKFVVGYANYLSQYAYSLMNLSDELYLNPAGGIEWSGYSVQIAFFKDALDKLEVAPEIFYAGKFKGATEPFRLNKMSDANRQQYASFLNDVYGNLISQTAALRGVDSGLLYKLADTLAIRTGTHALQQKLVDKLGYDDDARAAIGRRIGVKEISKINFMGIADYIKAERGKKQKSDDKIALIYAQGEIVNGMGGEDVIAGEKYRQMIRKAREDSKVRAIVLRINSPGGSALASEVIHHELMLAQKEKPVVVSMGDYAASGGYYIACGADSIFCQRNTLTGSIGVFAMMFDASKLLGNKLGIHFDEVTTGASATAGSPFRPLKPLERAFFQDGVDSTYFRFKSRVAAGRRLNIEYVDSIAQGHIWSGQTAIKIGLADKIGGLNDAIKCAARMAKIKTYELKEFPAVLTFWQKLLNNKQDQQAKIATTIRQQLGEEFYQSWKQMQLMRSWQGQTQTRLPFYLMPAATSAN